MIPFKATVFAVKMVLSVILMWIVSNRIKGKNSDLMAKNIDI